MMPKKKPLLRYQPTDTKDRYPETPPRVLAVRVLFLRGRDLEIDRVSELFIGFGSGGGRVVFYSRRWYGYACSWDLWLDMHIDIGWVL